jgi:RyR domain
MKSEQIAPVVHEAIRAYQGVLGQKQAPAWPDCTWEKQATIDGVELAMIDPSPGASHRKWMEGRIAEGWTYGPVKDAALKTNPTLVPFDELPPEEIAKDYLVIAITQALA